MAEAPVLVDKTDRVMTITLNRPDKLNAFSPDLREALHAALDDADADDDVRAVIVTGAGRGFCAGADLSSAGSDTFNYEKRAATPEDLENRDRGGVLTLRIFECKKPIIAAINGPAVGVGVTMTLPMDIRIASSAAKFGFVFARRGIVTEAASSWFLPRVVGISAAMEWTATGRIFKPDEALRRGLVSEVVEPDELLPRARELAREIADNTSAVSVALMRHMLWKMLGADHPMEGHKLDSKIMMAIGGGPDTKEGIASFLEKRPPNFPNKVSKDMPALFPWWEERKFE